MKKHTKTALKDLGWTAATCGLYFIIIFLRVLFTTESGQKVVEEKIDKQIKAKLLAEPKGKEDNK